MKIGQPIAHFRVEDGKPTLVPLPYRVAPLVLKPNVAAEIARLLGAPGSPEPRDSEKAPATAVPPKPSGGLAAAPQGAGSLYAIPVLGSGIASYAALPGDTPSDWSSLLILRQSVLGPNRLISARGPFAERTVPPAFQVLPTQTPAPLNPKLWLHPRPSEALEQQELQPLSPGLWLRPLPGSATTLANAAHLLAATQIGLETLKPLGVNPSFSPQLNRGLDAATAVVAVGELILETTRPTLRGLKRLLYYMKRLLYVAKFITDVAPVAPAVQHTFTVVGLVVKGTDELHSVRLTASRTQRLS